MAKYITKLINGEELYYLKDSEARQNIDTHEQDMDVHVTAAEKEYWNSKVNPPSYSAPTAKQLTYTGDPQTLLNAGSSTAGTIQYSIDQDEWSTDIPQATNAGTYYAYWRFIGSESIYVEPTAIEVTIEKANPAYTAPVANTLVYNGGSQELITGGSSTDGVFSYSSDGEEWNSAIPQGTDAIEYTVYWKFTGDDNHVDIDATPITIHISKVTPTVSAPVAKIGLIYNATSQDLINAGSTNFGVLQYSLDNVNYGTSIPQGINAVEYNIYYKVVGNSNINDVPAASITSSIAKVTPTVTAPTPKTLTFNGQAQELINAGSADFGTIQYKVGTDSWSTSIPTRTKGGSYTLSYKVVGDSNINDVSSESITCSISEKEITATVELSQTSYVYNGSAKTPSVTVKDGSVVIDPSEYSVSYSNNTNAGTATVSVYDNEGGDYDVIGSATFAITKASGSVTTAPTAKSLTYSGSAQTLANAGSGTGTMYYSLSETSGFSTTIPTGTSAGNYTVYYYAAESANYNQSATGSISVTIAKANGSVTTAPTAKSLTYSGDALTLANAGSGTGTMYYSLNSSSGFSTTIPTGTNATSYTVYYYAAESSNYKQSATGNISVSIAKANTSYTAPTAKSLTYNGNAQALLNAGSVTGGTMQYSSNNSTWGTTIPSQTNAGTYTSYWRIVGDSNHNDKASASISTTIAKANQSAPTATGATTTYNTTATATASGGGSQGSIEWSNGNTQTSVGSKTTKARWSGNSNYNASSWSNKVTLTMNKATGSVSTAPTNRGVTYSGSNQNLVNAGSGTGTMYYSLSSSSGFSTSIPVASSAGSYTVYYYAAASTNYTQSSTGSMTATIAKANQSAPTATGATATYGSTATASASGGGGVGSIEWSNGSSRTAVGSQSTQARWSGNSNYNASGWSNSVTLQVNKAAGSVSTAPTNTNYTYNGTARAVASGGSGTGTMYYRLGTSGSFTTSMPTMTNAGSSTLYYYAAESTNYTQSSTGSITVSVQKASQNAPTASGSTVSYGSTASASASGGGGQGSLEWSNGSSRTAVGSQNTQARWTGNSNYNASGWSNSVTLTVNKANQSAPTAYGATVNYGSTATATTSGGGGQGSIEWSNGSTRTAVGSQTTKARWSGNGNYNASGWSNEVTLTVSSSHAGHEFVDFGLPSGTKWATMNVGASSATGYGYYYQYGKGSAQYAATSGQSDYSGTENPLSTSVDTARQVWGGEWHMPTLAQYQELIDQCTWTWTTSGGINGYSVSKNGKSIFFPASGYWWEGAQYSVGTCGCYRSSTYSSSGAGQILYTDINRSSCQTFRHNCGCSVRGVVG